MITAFEFLDSVELTLEQRRELLDCIDKYSVTPEGDWLRNIIYHGFVYYWERDWEQRDIQGALLPALKRIYLRPEQFMFLAAPVAVHELRHYYQYCKYGKLLYRLLTVLGRLPLIGKLSPLEKDAFSEQDRAFKFITENCQ